VAALSVLGAALFPAAAATAAVRPCSSGLVALTFDDGPARTATPRLVRLLTERDVPATFFMLGSRVRSDPTDAKLVASRGFVVANHTWSHRQLTKLSDSAIRSELSSTRQEFRRRGITPSRLMRPPYGATNARVNRVIRGMGLAPVLWTIDTRDWAGGTPASIAAHVLSHLRRHQANIVLQHDGVRRSPTSIAAVPRIVSGARARGYCFTSLDAAGRPAVPVPRLEVSITGGREAGRVPAEAQLTLDKPTSRRASVRLSTVGGTATSGADFAPLNRTVVFPSGSTRATISIPVVDDRVVEGVERFTLRFTNASGLRLTTGSRGMTIVSDDAAPPPPPPPSQPPVP
jgi:peptidoglycan/xylan/chitin deacetylase (PgdA/CDA1 family)